jgi:hypothetical protein
MALTGLNSSRRAEVERIVRAVLSELNVTAARVARPTMSSERESERTLVLTSKVVSLAEVEGKLKEVSRLVVPRGAVFTPSARDELRKFAVAVASATGTPQAAKLKMVLAAAETSFDPTALAAALAGEGVALERIASRELTNAVDTLTRKVVVDKRLGLLITDMPAAAVCLANRQRGVRAVLAHSLAAVTEAVNMIAANVLVIDPRSRSLYEMRRLMRELIRVGRPERSTVAPERLN